MDTFAAAVFQTKVLGKTVVCVCWYTLCNERLCMCVGVLLSECWYWCDLVARMTTTVLSLKWLLGVTEAIEMCELIFSNVLFHIRDVNFVRITFRERQWVCLEMVVIVNSEVPGSNYSPKSLMLLVNWNSARALRVLVWNVIPVAYKFLPVDKISVYSKMPGISGTPTGCGGVVVSV